MYEEKPNDIIMCDFSEGSHDHPLIQLCFQSLNSYIIYIVLLHACVDISNRDGVHNMIVKTSVDTFKAQTKAQTSQCYAPSI